MLGVGASHLVDAQVKALLGHLRGHHERAAGANPAKDGVVQRVWDAADAKRLENDGVVVAAKQLKDGGVHLGRELEHEHALVQVVVDARLHVLACAVGHRARACRRRANDAIVADERQLRVVHARERVEAHRALLAGACARHDLAAKHHGNVVRRRVCRIQHALVQVDARVRERAAHGLL